jgi:hypothetical protein
VQKNENTITKLNFKLHAIVVIVAFADCGAGVVDVGIVDPQGTTKTVRPVITKKNDDLWYVEYTALVSGLHSVNVFFAGKAGAKSPYAVGVAAGMHALECKVCNSRSTLNYSSIDVKPQHLHWLYCIAFW